MILSYTCASIISIGNTNKVTQVYLSILYTCVTIEKVVQFFISGKEGGKQMAEEKGRKPDTKNTGQQKAATKAKNAFNGKNYERLYPFVKKGEKVKIERAASAAGQSLNDYVVTAVYQRMEREGQTDGGEQ